MGRYSGITNTAEIQTENMKYEKAWLKGGEKLNFFVKLP